MVRGGFLLSENFIRDIEWPFIGEPSRIKNKSIRTHRTILEEWTADSSNVGKL